jgi:plasmid stabilization system protein ParE
MNLHIQWTPVALLSLSEVFEYTFEMFGERQLRKLKTQISSTARRIATFPGLGKCEAALIEATGIEYRSIPVVSEIKLLYTVSEDTLFIEFVKNARMDDSTMLGKLNQGL